MRFKWKSNKDPCKILIKIDNLTDKEFKAFSNKNAKRNSQTWRKH